MGQDHIGIREGRRGEGHWDLRVRQDLHLNGYRALTLLEDLFAAGVLFMHANMRNQASQTCSYPTGKRKPS